MTLPTAPRRCFRSVKYQLPKQWHKAREHRTRLAFVLDWFYWWLCYNTKVLSLFLHLLISVKSKCIIKRLWQKRKSTKAQHSLPAWFLAKLARWWFFCLLLVVLFGVGIRFLTMDWYDRKTWLPPRTPRRYCWFIWRLRLSEQKRITTRSGEICGNSENCGLTWVNEDGFASEFVDLWAYILNTATWNGNLATLWLFIWFCKEQPIYYSDRRLQFSKLGRQITSNTRGKYLRTPCSVMKKAKPIAQPAEE